MKQMTQNNYGYIQNNAKNCLNSSFSGNQGQCNYQNEIKTRDNRGQFQNSNYPITQGQSNIPYTCQNLKGAHAFSCIQKGHEGNPLNLVCIDKNCLNKGVICTLCMHFEHQKHETLPLQIFLIQFKEQLSSVIQKDENGNSQIDQILEQITSVQNEVIDSLKIFSQKTYEAIQKTKDYLYQIFLQEIHEYQTIDIKIADLTETVKMYDCNMIKNPEHHMESISKMISKICPSLNYNQIGFNLNIFPSQSGDKLENIYNQLISVQDSIENEIKEMHSQIQQSLQNILDYSAQPKQVIEQSELNSPFTLNQLSNPQSSANFAKNSHQNSNYSSNPQSSTNASVYNKPVKSNYTGLPPHSQGICKQPLRNLNTKENQSNLNSSFQSDSSSYQNQQDNHVHNNSFKSRRKETHLLSRSYVSSSSPCQYSPSRNNSKVFSQQNSQTNQKGSLNPNQNYNLNVENFNIIPLHKISAHKNVIRDMVSVGDQKFATCSYDSIIKMWNKNNQQLIQEIKGHSDEVYQLSYSTKHNLLASSSYDKTIRIWKEYSEWKQLVTLKGHTGKTWAVKFIDATNKLAAGGNDRIIRIWNIFTGECENMLEGHQDTIWSLFPLSEGSKLVSGDNKYIKVWDHKTGKIIKSINAHDDRIYQLKEICFQKNTQQMILISTSMDKKVKIWNSKNYNLLFVFIESMIVTSLELILDRSIIIVGLWGDKKEGGISFWKLPLEDSQKENIYNLQEPQKIMDYFSNYSGVSQLIYDYNTQKLYTSHSNGTVEVIGLKWK